MSLSQCFLLQESHLQVSTCLRGKTESSVNFDKIRNCLTGRRFRTTLLRVMCYCSSAQDFQQQHIHLELTYLASGYSLRFIDSRVTHFFDYFQADDLHYSMDQIMYDKFRQQCFNFKDIRRALSNQLRYRYDTSQVIHLHYRYEYGARCQFNKGFHKLWITYFDRHAHLDAKKMTVRLTTKHLHSLNALLAQQKSSCWASL